MFAVTYYFVWVLAIFCSGLIKTSWSWTHHVPPRWPPVLLDFTVQVLGLQLGSTTPSLRWLPFRKLLHLHEEPRSYSHPAGCKPLRTNVRLFHQSRRSTWLRTGLTHSLEDPLYTVILIFKTLLVDTMKSSPRGLPSNRELKIHILTPYCPGPPWAMEAPRVELEGNCTRVVFFNPS